MQSVRPVLHGKEHWRKGHSGPPAGDKHHPNVLEHPCSHVPCAPSGHHTSALALAGATSFRETSRFRVKLASHAARYHFANGLSSACISATGTWLPSLSGTRSQARGIAGENIPRIFPFNLSSAGKRINLQQMCWDQSDLFLMITVGYTWGCAI